MNRPARPLFPLLLLMAMPSLLSAQENSVGESRCGETHTRGLLSAWPVAEALGLETCRHWLADGETPFAFESQSDIAFEFFFTISGVVVGAGTGYL